MNLLMVRHAESQGNASGNYSTAVADSLSAQGEAQALCLADALSSWTFDRIMVSPRQRAMETITPYLAATHQRAEIWPEIAEACWHDEREAPSDGWNPQPTMLPPSAVAHFSYRNDRVMMPAHPESFGEGLRRVHATLCLLHALADQADGLFLMVTHGHFIRELLNLMLGTRTPVRFPQVNCGLTLMSFDGAWSMEFCNRQSVMAESNRPAGD